jgi:hypothetical protein
LADQNYHPALKVHQSSNLKMQRINFFGIWLEIFFSQITQIQKGNPSSSTNAKKIILQIRFKRKTQSLRTSHVLLLKSSKQQITEDILNATKKRFGEK